MICTVSAANDFLLRKHISVNKKLVVRKRREIIASKVFINKALNYKIAHKLFHISHLIPVALRSITNHLNLTFCNYCAEMRTHKHNFWSEKKKWEVLVTTLPRSFPKTTLRAPSYLCTIESWADVAFALCYSAFFTSCCWSSLALSLYRSLGWFSPCIDLLSNINVSLPSVRHNFSQSPCRGNKKKCRMETKFERLVLHTLRFRPLLFALFLNFNVYQNFHVKHNLLNQSRSIKNYPPINPRRMNKARSLPIWPPTLQHWIYRNMEHS